MLAMLVRSTSGRRSRARLASALGFALTVLGGLGTAHAATLTVNSVGDTPDAVDNDGVCGTTGVPNSCTLRAAIEEANTNGDASNTIDLSGVSGIITATTSLPPITKAVAINGPSARVTVSGGDLVSLFRFVCTTAPCPSGGNYSITNLIVTDGSTTDSAGGGGIYFGAAGTVNFTLTNVDVTSSTATTGPGGGIAAVLVSNNSTLTLTNVDIGASGTVGPDSNGNKATAGDGGGLWVRFDGTTATMTLENSAVVNNNAGGNGGGIAVARGRLNVYETTLNANIAGAKGGGIYLGKTGSAGGSARIENVTIVGNTAATGGGGGIGAASDNPAGSSMTFTTITSNVGHGLALATDPDVTFPGNSASFPFTSNIIASNGDPECAAAFSHSDPDNSGYNLTNTGDGSCGFSADNNDRFGADAAALGLATLAANSSDSGAPQTRALLAGSLAIDAGNPNWDTGSDQRGATTQDGGADGTPGDSAPVRDIGAYEFGGFGLVQFTLANYDVNEDTTPAVVTIKRYGTGTALTTTPQVQFSSEAVTAGAGTSCGDDGVDYTDANPTSFTFTANGLERTASFTICNDEVLAEPDETFEVTLTEPGTENAGYDLGPISSGTVTIQDVENGVFAFDNTVAHSANEGNTGAGGSVTLTIKRTSGTDGVVRVSYATTSTCSPACGAAANTDYTAVTSFVDFADGETSKTVTVSFVGDTAYEGNETFRVNLTGVSCQGLVAGESCDARLIEPADHPDLSALVTITNDDAPLTGQFQFEFGTYTVDETGTLTVKVRRVGGTDGAVSVDVDGVSGTAEASTQFNVTSPISGTLNWAAGDAADKTVTVTPVDDPGRESDKHFTLVLSNAQTSTAGLDAPTIGSPNPATVTLTSDEKPAFQFDIDPAYTHQEDGSGGSPQVTLTVTWDSFTGEDVTVPYYTLDGTAVSPVDYTGIPQGTPGTITATGGGATSATFQVTVASDSTAETNETFTAHLGTPEGGAVLGANDSATVTIVDPAGVRFTAASYTRANEQNGATITVSVERFGDISQAFSVDYEISQCATAGCATQGDDFYRLAGTTGTLSWNDDMSTPNTQTFSVNVQADTLIEGDETFLLTLSNPQKGAGPSSPGALGLAEATGIIPDDDYRFQVVEVSPLAVGEGATQATITVQRIGSTRGAASVELATADGTAAAGSDYTAPAPASAVTWDDATGGNKTFNVAVTGDAVDELDETFTVTLGNASTNLSGEATPISGSPLTVSITDDDTAVVSIANGSATEAAGVTLAVSLSTPSDRSVTVTYDTADGTATAASDYTAVSGGQVTFAAGETAKNVVVATLGDARNEADETFTVALSAPTNGAQVSGTAGTGTGTIVDDDPVPALSVADAMVTEGTGTDATLTFVVSLSAASGRTVTVNVATTDGTAVAPDDYAALSTTPVTFAPGDISKNVSITVEADALDELDETLTLTLSSATNATIADASATGTIVDDDAVPALSVADATVAEGTDADATLTFVVSLSAASGRTITVDVATTDGTALAPGDYAALSTTPVTFAPGDISRNVSVTVEADALDELAETLTLTLSSAANATIADASATGTITDDDTSPTVTLSASTPTMAETGGTATITATLSVASGQAVTVNLGFAGVALRPGDYTASAVSITIPAGAMTGSITLTSVGDGANEPDETVVVDITGVTNATESGTQSQTVTITDDDRGGGGGSWSWLSLWLLLPALRRRWIAA